MTAEKEYLGDGVYVEEEGGMIKLTTEDGMRVTNCIYLEPDVWRALLRWAGVDSPVQS